MTLVVESCDRLGCLVVSGSESIGIGKLINMKISWQSLRLVVVFLMEDYWHCAVATMVLSRVGVVEEQDLVLYNRADWLNTVRSECL